MHANERRRELQQRGVGRHRKDTDAHDFFNLLTSERLLAQVEEHLPPHRERLYPPTETLSMFLAQALSADRSCQNAVNGLAVKRVQGGLRAVSTHTGGYCKARQRLPVEMVSGLARESARLLSQQTPSAWRWQGRPVKLVDGTTVSMPDTPENQQVYPQSASQPPGIGFPMARVVGVLCLGSGVVLDAAMGPFKGKGASEYALFLQQLDAFEAGDIVLADRYYCSYFLVALLRARGVDVVFEQHAARKTDFRRGESLGTRDHIVQWSKPKIRPRWMTPAHYGAFPQELSVREVRAKGKVLVTTLLSPKQAPRHQLAALFEQRWHIELDLRNIKSTLGMDVLSCKTSDMVEKELWVYLLAYNLIRLLMAEAAVQANVLPRQLSFKHTLQLWLVWSASPSPYKVVSNIEFFALIAQQRVGNRPGRIEPRAVKRRPKPHPLLNTPRQQAREEIRANGHPKKAK